MQTKRARWRRKWLRRICRKSRRLRRTSGSAAHDKRRGEKGHPIHEIEKSNRSRRKFKQGFETVHDEVVVVLTNHRLLPQNYRPISLLPGITKISERFIGRRIEEFTEEMNIILDEQFEFRKDGTTSVTIGGIRLRWINMVTGIVFLDVIKASDRVWHEGLVQKMN